MVMTDPVADCLTRIRNACRARQKRVDIPASKIKVEIARILLENHYIQNYKVLDDGKQGVLRVYLKYHDDRPVLHGIERVSRPGLRVYRKRDGLPRVRGGIGTAIVSTSRGLLTDREAREAGIGGEVVARVW
ncbi:MAG TPA: 30S ribosomal protein S8 [Gemmatimonadota bacterium]|jgi:small subunit ribosomal protein S8|nr:30S ribosomal protein S8 [Gemmatimonadota bacterium]